MKTYVLIHPFGGNYNDFNKGRELCVELRKKHPDMFIIYGLDNLVYANETTPHSVIDKWSEELVSRCDGIIVPIGWENSEGCQYEVAAAEAKGKEILTVKELM